MEIKITIGNRVRCHGLGVHLIVPYMAMFLFNAAAQDTILVIHPKGSAFEMAAKGIIDDLHGEIEVITTVVTQNTKEKDVCTTISQYRPSAVVLMDNSVIRLYKKCLKTLKDSITAIPVIALMAILVDEAVSGIDNVAAIRYEVPIVTSSVILRSLTRKPLHKIGIIHRKLMREMVESNSTLCEREHITIIRECSECDNARVSIKRALKNLVRKEKVDALWIPNDNVLLTPTLLQNTWIPLAVKYNLPVIVGVEVLVHPKLHFGTLAVMPDHEALGVQAAQMILNIHDDGWKITQMRIEPALSVRKVLNLKNAKRTLDIKDEILISIDKVLR